MKFIFSILFFGMNSLFAANNTNNLFLINSYKSCLHKSNLLNSPNMRDEEKISCFHKFKKYLPDNECYDLAKVFEYTQNTDKHLFSCIKNEDRAQLTPTCLRTSRKMIYAENNDQLLWSCIQKLNSKYVKSNCTKLANNMKLPHNKSTAIQYCENSSEIH